jgi:aspartate racemase
MKKIGIVGGIGWRSTVEYYSEICRRADAWHAERKLTGVSSTPEIAIESLDVARSVALHGRDGDEKSWQRFDDYHRGAFRRLEVAGAEVGVMASNSPHHRFDEIVRGLSMETISLVDAAAGECARIGARRVLILGWPLAMRSRKFREVFGKHGVELSGPKDEASREKTVELIAELERGREKGAAVRLGRIVRASWGFEEGPVVCLACTRLRLAFPAFTAQPSFKYGGVMYVNTSSAHIAAVLKAVGMVPGAEHGSGTHEQALLDAGSGIGQRAVRGSERAKDRTGRPAGPA